MDSQIRKLNTPCLPKLCILVLYDGIQVIFLLQLQAQACVSSKRID